MVVIGAENAANHSHFRPPNGRRLRSKVRRRSFIAPFPTSATHTLGRRARFPHNVMDVLTPLGHDDDARRRLMNGVHMIGILLVIAALLIFQVAAWRWAYDSRDPSTRDWY